LSGNYPQLSLTVCKLFKSQILLDFSAMAINLGQMMTKYLTETTGDVTPKQREYIISLVHRIPKDVVEEDSNSEDQNQDVDLTIQRLLKDDQVTLDTLPKSQIGRLISSLQREATATDKQIEIVFQKISLDKIREILRRDVQIGDKLTIREVSFLMKTPSQFTYWSSEHPEKSCDRYEYGWQDSAYCEDGKMYYLKFFDLLMIDFDGIDLEQVRQKLISIPQYSYALYKTYNGFHAFVISRSIQHSDPEARFLLERMGCDRYYMLFSTKAGFKVRLTPKKDRDETVVAEYIETIGVIPLLPECLEMLEIHDHHLGITGRD
jgi:hypothetical protein